MLLPIFALGLSIVSPLGLSEAQGQSSAGMSREERLRQHRERINRILEERRQQEEAARAASAGAQPSAGGPVAVGGPPGQVIPGGPVQPMPGQPVGGVQPDAVVSRPPGTGGVPPAQGVPGAPGNPGSGPAPSGGQAVARTEARAIMALYPFDSSILVGDTFQTEVLADARRGTYDSASFVLRWDPRDLNPLALDFSAVAAISEEEVEYGLDKERGILAVRVTFREDVALSGQTLASITWEGLRPRQATSIRFETSGEPGTGIFSNDENFLGTSFSNDDGILHSTVIIRGGPTRQRASRTSDGGLVFTTEEPEIPTPSARFRMTVDKTQPQTGEVAVASVFLDNPDAIPFDRLRLYLQFDPQRTQVLDTDRGNRIRTGTNIREENPDIFNFDFLRVNRVHESKGWIEFDAGNEGRSIETTGGLVAQIALKALLPGPAELVLIRNAAGMAPDTDLSSLGRSVLSPQSIGEARPLAGARFQIRGNPLTTENRTPGNERLPSVILRESGLTKQRQFGP